MCTNNGRNPEAIMEIDKDLHPDERHKIGDEEILSVEEISSVE
jgi:hypothetical protein